MMDKKLNKFKSSIISELTKNRKLLIQSEFENITQEYTNQSEEVSLTKAMLQQHVTNLKQNNFNLLEKARKDQQDLEKYYKENECLFGKVSINISDAWIDCANQVSRTDDMVLVRFTTFCHHTMFFIIIIKNPVDLANTRLDLLIKMGK